MPGSLRKSLVVMSKPEYWMLKRDKDAWFEIPLSNRKLFDTLALKGVPELVPGRLFSTRIPRDLASNPEVGKSFMKKVQKNNLDTVCILVEKKEYEEYSETSIEDFYESCGLNYICNPIEDFGVPKVDDFTDTIRDVTKVLAAGKNVLVHCAGGNGRTGMILCGILKNCGLDNPIGYARKIKSTYVETEGQEIMVSSMPVTLDEELMREHPVLSKAIIMDKLFDVIAPKNQKDTKQVTLTEKQKEQQKLAFEQLDEDKSGSISVQEFLNVCDSLGEPRKKKMVNKLIKKLDVNKDGSIDFDEFLSAMSVITI
mmetsp:Transcript_12767/g.15860  ORF Transcript_12767/g.15860 Transcript_12767/m.15860 type:complete len:312 (-) Transcript_12767:1081-2016(-)